MKFACPVETNPSWLIHVFDCFLFISSFFLLHRAVLKKSWEVVSWPDIQQVVSERDDIKTQIAGVGHKIPSTEVLNRIDPPGLLREPSSVTDANGRTDSARTPTGARPRPQLRLQTNSARTPTGAGPHLRLRSKRTPPGLLREPGSVTNSDRW